MFQRTEYAAHTHTISAKIFCQICKYQSIFRSESNSELLKLGTSWKLIKLTENGITCFQYGTETTWLVIVMKEIFSSTCLIQVFILGYNKEATLFTEQTIEIWTLIVKKEFYFDDQLNMHFASNGV